MHVKVDLYPLADDINVSYEAAISNLDDLSGVVNIEPDKLSVWITFNKLTLHIMISHFATFPIARLKQNNVNISLC